MHLWTGSFLVQVMFCHLPPHSIMTLVIGLLRTNNWKNVNTMNEFEDVACKKSCHLVLALVYQYCLGICCHQGIIGSNIHYAIKSSDDTLCSTIKFCIQNHTDKKRAKIRLLTYIRYPILLCLTVNNMYQTFQRIYVLIFSEGTKTYIYILCHYSTLIWHRYLKSFLK